MQNTTSTNSSPEIKAETTSTTRIPGIERITPELHEIVHDLLASPEGYRVYAYQGRNPNRTGEEWFVVERDGRVGTVSYDRLNGYHVAFCIVPSREYGSGLTVWDDRGDDRKAPNGTRGSGYAQGMGTMLDACKIATGESFANTWANPGHPLPNHGMAHFAWAKLVELTEEAGR
jgi:hypothetical protein